MLVGRGRVGVDEGGGGMRGREEARGLVVVVLWPR
jgi:hypothetical protein